MTLSTQSFGFKQILFPWKSLSVEIKRRSLKEKPQTTFENSSSQTWPVPFRMRWKASKYFDELSDNVELFLFLESASLECKETLTTSFNNQWFYFFQCEFYYFSSSLCHSREKRAQSAQNKLMFRVRDNRKHFYRPSPGTPHQQRWKTPKTQLL